MVTRCSSNLPPRLAIPSTPEASTHDLNPVALAKLRALIGQERANGLSDAEIHRKLLGELRARFPQGMPGDYEGKVLVAVPERVIAEASAEGM